MEGTEVFIPCKVGINNYRELLDMEKAKGKASVMLFPGVTKAFKDKAGAIDHLNKKLTSDAKQLFRVVFKVTVCADLPPCDVKKMVGEGDAEMKDATLPDGIFQRLTAQVNKYQVEEGSTTISSQNVRKAIDKKDGDPSRVKNTF